MHGQRNVKLSILFVIIENLLLSPTCRNIVNVSSLLDPNDQSTTICRNAENYTPNNTASNARRTKSSCNTTARNSNFACLLFLKFKYIFKTSKHLFHRLTRKPTDGPTGGKILQTKCLINPPEKLFWIKIMICEVQYSLFVNKFCRFYFF